MNNIIAAVCIAPILISVLGLCAALLKLVWYEIKKRP